MDGAHPDVKPTGGKMDKEALDITRSRVELHKVDKQRKKAAKVSHFTCNSPLSLAELSPVFSQSCGYNGMGAGQAQPYGS